MLSPPWAQALRRQAAWLPGWWLRQQSCLSRPRRGLRHSRGGCSFPVPFLMRGSPRWLCGDFTGLEVASHPSAAFPLSGCMTITYEKTEVGLDSVHCLH